MSTIINATTTNGVVIQPDNSGSLVLQTNSGTTALTISTAQNATFAAQATIPTINLTGGQIVFPATQSASANANTLDDYEEGTWSVSWGSLTGTPANLVGRYVKVGKVVTWQYVTGAGAISGTGNTVNFTLPFPMAQNYWAAGSWIMSNLASAGQLLMYEGTNATCYPTTFSAAGNIAFSGSYIATT